MSNSAIFYEYIAHINVKLCSLVLFTANCTVQCETGRDLQERPLACYKPVDQKRSIGLCQKPSRGSQLTETVYTDKYIIIHFY